MKLDELIKLLEHTRQTMPGDTPVCFSTSGSDPKNFDFGEHNRDNYCCCITPYETPM